MKSDDLTLRVLIEIRDAAHATNARLDQTNARLDQTNARLDGLSERLDVGLREVRDEMKHAIFEVDLRAATRHIEHTAATRDLYALLSDRLELRDRVEQCERDISDLKRRKAR